MPCPLDPTIQLHGIVPSACTVFKSSLAPIKLVFNIAGASLANRARRATNVDDGWLSAMRASTLERQFCHD